MLPNQQSHQKCIKRFLILGELHEDKLCDILHRGLSVSLQTLLASKVFGAKLPKRPRIVDGRGRT